MSDRTMFFSLLSAEQTFYTQGISSGTANQISISITGENFLHGKKFDA